MSADNQSHLRKTHVTDEFGTKFVNKTGELQKKAEHAKHHDDSSSSSDSDGPAGGYDETGVPDAPPGYTIRITFHRAENLPFADFPSLSSDPYIHATFKTNLPKRHKQDPDLFIRIPTIHRNTDPKWETQWVIAHVPASGFFMKCRLYDEDPSDHDDRLGNVHVNVGRITDDWQGIKNQPYDLKKRMGSKRAYTIRGMAALFKRSVKMSGRLFVSVENLGRSPGEHGGRSYTVAPLPWTRHHSPLIGRIAGTKDREESKDGKKSVERYNFQAVQMQLKGPIPAPMYHRYVEFKPFVAGMFTDATIRGRILNRALHHQHARVYNYDGSTVYGIFEKPCIELTQQFLEFVHYDQGGRIYTYVLSLDGLWRFTETGKEFGIDMLSKHTMHSDVSIYIAFSGEFFVRRLKNDHKEHSRVADAASSHNARKTNGVIGDVEPPAIDDENDKNKDGEHSHENISKDPSNYELIIDNDSGTYRPNANLLPLLRDFLAENLPGLRIATLDCQKDEELMQKLKQEQRDRKEKSGKKITYMQNSSMSSLSSSDEEKLDAIASGQGKQSATKRKINKFQSRRSKEHAHLEKNSTYTEPEETQDGHDRDSRDNTSGTTDLSYQKHNDSLGPGGEANNGERKGSGYENRDLPELLKKNSNGHVPEQQKASNYNNQNRENISYVEPETGDNKPTGGIAYNQVVSTAGMEKQRGKDKEKDKDSV